MGNILFVSIEKIKEKSIFGLNTDDKIITGALVEVQDIELEPLIGETYFETLKTQIDTGEVTDENKKVLTEVIQPYLVYGTLVYSIVPLHFKINNKGVNKSTDSNLSIADSKDLEAFKSYYKEKFESYKRKLIAYFTKDESAETVTSSSEDTTSSVLNFYLPDVADYSQEYYESRAFKTGIYRKH
ncbi:hypothetical protein [Pedobacter sp. CFBP9032]|uniref:DUF6712 family protein n=1 Tax=Pedobacter sp. CFBP9032 TaxID=3096539 RepID=UPI002A6AE83E|nr:hypothetical protein [Pedobacter sp. CFBP9032]MDY0906568.1 hypothetical protein [Pedobacter sp. CFBP9032]